jgi:hypothetical protein
MVQVPQRLQALADDLVAGDSAKCRDECDTARIVFKRWIVKALSLANPRKGMSSCHETNSRRRSR